VKINFDLTPITTLVIIIQHPGQQQITRCGVLSLIKDNAHYEEALALSRRFDIDPGLFF
jgi:hypothetical protein